MRSRTQVSDRLISYFPTHEAIRPLHGWGHPTVVLEHAATDLDAGDQAAIHSYHGAGNIGRAFTGEKRHRVGVFFRLSIAQAREYC